MCGRVWGWFGGLSLCYVWDKFCGFWGSEFLLCVLEFRVGFWVLVYAVCGIVFCRFGG